MQAINNIINGLLFKKLIIIDLIKDVEHADTFVLSSR